MASQRGVTQLWTAADAANAGGGSAFAHVGAKPYVCVFFANVNSGGNLTVGIQVASKAGLSAGMNEADESADGGLLWHTYYSWKDPTSPVDFVVANNAEVAFDLSPFAPELVRIVTAEGFTIGEVVASLTASGPN